VKSIIEGRGSRETRIEHPKITNYLVPVNEVNRPKSEIKLQQREIRSPCVAGKPEQRPGQPASRPERVAPEKPKETIKPQERKTEEKPREQRPEQKKIEKPNEPRPSEKNGETRKEQKRHEEDEEKPRK
jgi:hypothetical protein